MILINDSFDNLRALKSSKNIIIKAHRLGKTLFNSAILLYCRLWLWLLYLYIILLRIDRNSDRNSLFNLILLIFSYYIIYLVVVLIYSAVVIDCDLILYVLLYTHRRFYLYNYSYIVLLKLISQINIIGIVAFIIKAISDSL